MTNWRFARKRGTLEDVAIVEAPSFYDARELAKVILKCDELVYRITDEPPQATVRWEGTDYGGGRSRHKLVEWHDV